MERRERLQIDRVGSTQKIAVNAFDEILWNFRRVDSDNDVCVGVPYQLMEELGMRDGGYVVEYD